MILTNKAFYLFFIIISYSFLNSQTVNYYTDTFGGVTEYQLDSTFLGDSPDIAYWESNQGLLIGGYNGTLDPDGEAIEDMIADAAEEDLEYEESDVHDCIESTINCIQNRFTDTFRLWYLDFNESYTYEESDIEIWIENDPFYWLGESDDCAAGGPGWNGGLNIASGIAQINALPDFLDDYYWEVSDDEPASNAGSNVLYLRRAVFHEIYHTLGVHHIFSVDAVMNEEFETGPEGWVSDVTNYDFLALSKLYDPYVGTSIPETIIQSNINNLFNNHPNPFNPTTTISYNLTNKIHNPKIEIYNLKGQKVKSYSLKAKKGKNSVDWSGKDKYGKAVSSGVYFYRLLNNNRIIQTKKMVLMK